MNLPLSEGYGISDYHWSDRHRMVENLQDGAVQKTTLLIPFPYTLADAEAWLATLVKARAAGQPLLKFAIRNSSGAAVGGIGFHPAAAGQAHTRELGYWLAREYWGRGIMTGAVRALVDHAFRYLGICRVTAVIFHGNTASARVLEKAGFLLEAPRLRAACCKDGRFSDGILYARTAVNN